MRSFLPVQVSGAKEVEGGHAQNGLQFAIDAQGDENGAEDDQDQGNYSVWGPLHVRSIKRAVKFVKLAKRT